MRKDQLKVLMATIDLLKVQLNEVISESTSLTNSEVLEKSQELDQLITKYYEMLKKIG